MAVKRVNIDIDIEVWKQIGIMAATLDCTKRDLVEKAILGLMLQYHSKGEFSFPLSLLDHVSEEQFEEANQ